MSIQNTHKTCSSQQNIHETSGLRPPTPSPTPPGLRHNDRLPARIESLCNAVESKELKLTLKGNSSNYSIGAALGKYALKKPAVPINL